MWDLWTTKEGIESWWGPDGFTVEVHELDLRPDGVLLYAMTATAPEQIEFMKNAGMPLTTESRMTYTEVVAAQRLAYMSLADFIPGVEPYKFATVVDLYQGAQSVQTVMTVEAMHDYEWTQRLVMGRERARQPREGDCNSWVVNRNLLGSVHACAERRCTIAPQKRASGAMTCVECVEVRRHKYAGSGTQTLWYTDS